MFKHVKRQRSPGSDGGESTGSEVESDVDDAGSQGSAGASEAGSIPDHIPSADTAAAEPIFVEPDGRRRCVLCPDKALISSEIEAVHLAGQTHARRVKRYIAKLAEFRRALEADDDDPIDTRQIVALCDLDKAKRIAAAPAPGKSKRKRVQMKRRKARQVEAAVKAKSAAPATSS